MKFKFESIEFLFSTSLKSFLSIIVIVCNPAFHHRWTQIVLMCKVLISGFSITTFFNNHHLKFKTVFRHNKIDPKGKRPAFSYQQRKHRCHSYRSLELEKTGYIKRSQGRDEKGKMTAITYTPFMNSRKVRYRKIQRN